MSDSSLGHWLVLEERVLANVEVADSRRSRRKGLLGRDAVDGALLLRPACMVHTFGMKFSIDVAHLDAHGKVLRTTTMKPNRVGALVPRSRSVLETEAGALGRWGVSTGETLEIR